ncbi:MAG TPA: hypothetical protein VLC73_14475 [Burkholderiales bacterium]|nr:hypothetical protein [Burkholderiales bacterium]
MSETSDAARVRRQVWLMLGAAIALYGLLRLVLGPLPQDPAYHALADTRTGPGNLPRAGDVLINLAILAAGLFGLALRNRMNVAPEERTAADVLIAAAILTAFGSSYYHLVPANATLIWDRLGIAVVLTSLLVVVMADRVHPLFAREALWPFTGLGIASVLLWGASEAMGQEDLLLYLVVRVGAGAAIAFLVIFRPARHTGTIWLVAAMLCEVAMAILERLDHEVFRLTGGLASGHNLKHVLAGIALAFVFWWLRTREMLTRRP